VSKVHGNAELVKKVEELTEHNATRREDLEFYGSLRDELNGQNGAEPPNSSPDRLTKVHDHVLSEKGKLHKRLREEIDPELAQAQAENEQLKMELERLGEAKSELQAALLTHTRSTTQCAQAPPTHTANEGSTRLAQVCGRTYKTKAGGAAWEVKQVRPLRRVERQVGRRPRANKGACTMQEVKRVDCQRSERQQSVAHPDKTYGA
jgi:hypothetical protein